MRLFVAIDCDTVKKEMIIAQNEFSSIKARFTQSFHLTLQFIGEVSKAQSEVIREELEGVCLAPFVLKISELGIFTSYSQMVIWRGVSESKSLIQLHQQIYHLINGDENSYNYSPHITLARIKNHQRMNEREKRVLDEGLKKKLPECSFQVNQFKLYESTITTKGPNYRVIQEYTL